MGKSFRYLGRYFDFNMSDEEHKSELLDVFNDIMNKINELPLHPKNKILLYSRYLLSKISWNFTVSDISKTWICETFDGIASKYIRKLSTLGVFSRSSENFDGMLRSLKCDAKFSKYIKTKIVNMCIRTSYYIFCKRNKVWDNPKLMSI
jgi:hypothetical protein